MAYSPTVDDQIHACRQISVVFRIQVAEQNALFHVRFKRLVRRPVRASSDQQPTIRRNSRWVLAEQDSASAASAKDLALYSGVFVVHVNGGSTPPNLKFYVKEKLP